MAVLFYTLINYQLLKAPCRPSHQEDQTTFLSPAATAPRTPAMEDIRRRCLGRARPFAARGTYKSGRPVSMREQVGSTNCKAESFS